MFLGLAVIVVKSMKRGVKLSKICLNYYNEKIHVYTTNNEELTFFFYNTIAIAYMCILYKPSLII